MRNRILDPNFWLDEELAKKSDRARLLYQGTWGLCDDHFATFPARPAWIKAQVFPYDANGIEKELRELEDCGKLIRFKAPDGLEYYWLKNFFKYQRIDRPSKAKYPEYKPEYQILDEPSTSPRPEVKLSKAKLSKDKVIATQSVAVQTTNFYIDLFKPINPSFERLFSNTTQRAAIERMESKWGKEKLSSSIQAAVNCFGKKYAPTITTPLQLESKIGELVAYYKKQSESGEGKFSNVSLVTL